MAAKKTCKLGMAMVAVPNEIWHDLDSVEGSTGTVIAQIRGYPDLSVELLPPRRMHDGRMFDGCVVLRGKAAAVEIAVGRLKLFKVDAQEKLSSSIAAHRNRGGAAFGPGGLHVMVDVSNIVTGLKHSLRKRAATEAKRAARAAKKAEKEAKAAAGVDADAEAEAEAVHDAEASAPPGPPPPGTPPPGPAHAAAGASERKAAATPGPDVGPHDYISQVTLNVPGFVELAVNGVPDARRGLLEAFASSPRGVLIDDHDEWEAAGFKVSVEEVEPGKTEQVTDVRMHSSIQHMLDIVHAKHQTLVLATGDGNANNDKSKGGTGISFPDIVEKAVAKGWNVRILAWDASLSRNLRRLADKHPSKVSVHLLEAYEHALRITDGDLERAAFSAGPARFSAGSGSGGGGAAAAGAWGRHRGHSGSSDDQVLSHEAARAERLRAVPHALRQDLYDIVAKGVMDQATLLEEYAAQHGGRELDVATATGGAYTSLVEMCYEMPQLCISNAVPFWWSTGDRTLRVSSGSTALIDTNNAHRLLFKLMETAIMTAPAADGIPFDKLSAALEEAYWSPRELDLASLLKKAKYSTLHAAVDGLGCLITLGEDGVVRRNHSRTHPQTRQALEAAAAGAPAHSLGGGAAGGEALTAAAAPLPERAAFPALSSTGAAASSSTR